jgi:hypothetical protein
VYQGRQQQHDRQAGCLTLPACKGEEHEAGVAFGGCMQIETHMNGKVPAWGEQGQGN